jgi:hypothetical protein
VIFYNIWTKEDPKPMILKVDANNGGVNFLWWKGGWVEHGSFTESEHKLQCRKQGKGLIEMVATRGVMSDRALITLDIYQG